MSFSRKAFLIAGAVLVVLAAAATVAEIRTRDQTCGLFTSLKQIDADIGRCTAIIQSAGATPQERAKAFAGRGLLHALARKFDRAVEDYDQALSLEPTDVELLVQRGYATLQKGDRDRALRDLDLAIQLKPDQRTAFHYRAWAHHGKGDYDRAIQDYDEAIRLVPRDAFFQPTLAGLHLDRGITYASKGDYERAIADFDEALRVGRAERIFGYRLANYNIPTFQLSADGRVVKFSGGVNHGGARALARLLATNPSIKVIHLDSPGGLYAQAMETAKVIKSRRLDTYVSDGCESACVELFLAGRERLLGPGARIGFHQTSVRGTPSIDGNAMMKAGFLKFGMSQPFVRRALETKPDAIWHPSQAELLAERVATRVVDAAALPTPVYLPASHLRGVDFLYTFGDQHFKEGRLDRAIQYFDEVIRRDPDHVLALMRRGEAFHEKGDLDRAMQDYDRASKLDPQSATILSSRGRLKLDRRDNDGALEDFTKAFALSPDDPDVNYYRGIVHIRKMAHDVAIEYFSAAIIAAPDYNSALTARGEVYLEKSDYGRAIVDFDRALQLDATAAKTWNNRCWARALAGQLDSALADCNESLRLKADNANTFDSRAFVYLKMGEYNKAIADFDAALKLAPDLAHSLYGRGLAKLKKGDIDGGNADITAGRTKEPAIDEQFARFGLKAP